MELHNLSPQQKKDHIRVKVQNCVVGNVYYCILHHYTTNYRITRKTINLGIGASGYLVMEWKLSSKSFPMVKEICRDAFAQAYDIGTTYLSCICAGIKAGDMRTSAAINDRFASTISREDLQTFANSHGLSMSEEEFGLAALPNGAGNNLLS